jgi:high-affinity iron transporter
MLINTVILFLRDALPFFVLLSLVLSMLPVGLKWLSLSLLAGLAGSLLLLDQIDRLSQQLAGAGMELMLFSCHLLVYLAIVAAAFIYLQELQELPHSAKSKQKTTTLQGIAGLMIATSLFINGVSFSIYFVNFWSQADAPQSILLGTALGLGICLSISVLLYFSMLWLKQMFGPISIVLALVLHASGQLADAVSLLVQVDWLEQSEGLWDLSNIFHDQSEFAHLFNALFGYRASPSYHQLGLYSVACILPLLGYYWLRLNFNAPTQSASTAAARAQEQK